MVKLNKTCSPRKPWTPKNPRKAGTNQYILDFLRRLEVGSELAIDADRYGGITKTQRFVGSCAVRDGVNIESEGYYGVDTAGTKIKHFVIVRIKGD